MWFGPNDDKSNQKNETKVKVMNPGAAGPVAEHLRGHAAKVHEFEENIEKP